MVELGRGDSIAGAAGDAARDGLRRAAAAVQLVAAAAGRLVLSVEMERRERVGEDVGRGRDTYLRPLRPCVRFQQRDLPPRELQLQPLVGRLILIALKTLLIKTRVLALDLHQRVGGELARGPPSG